MAANYLTKFRKPNAITNLLIPFLCNLFIAGDSVQHMVVDYFAGQNGKTVNYRTPAYLQDVNINMGTQPIRESGIIETASKVSHIYLANERQGTVGKLFPTDSENPYDNFFTVTLPDNIDLEKFDAVLSYDLYGLQSGLQTTKSINYRGSYGGKSIVKTEEWIKVKENIAGAHLKPGQNDIFFNRREANDYQYKIRNLAIELVQKKKGLVLNENIVTNSGGTIYLAGMVADNSVTKIEAYGTEIPVSDGIFEHVFKHVPLKTEKLAVKYKVNNGQVQVYNFPVRYENPMTNVQFDNPDAGFSNKKIYTVADHDCIEYDGCLSISTNRLDEKGFLAIEGLYFKDVRTLDADLENVTAGKFEGYRIKKQDLADSIGAEIHLRYDEHKIPTGYTARDIKTFYFDKSQKTWKALPVDSLDLANSEIITTIYNNDTDYINGVIKVPESPETGNFTPTTITDMKFADPAVGVVSIPPPSPNSTGAVATSFPLKLPQGRNGMQPSLEVSYNSEAGNGWMGIGWNLSTPAISVNTGWGVPMFDEDKETEIYSLNGADLVLKIDGTGEYTNPHRTANITATSGRQFYLRKEGSYQKIIRHGDSPKNYWWEVTDKMGNKSYYGGFGALDNAAVIKTGDGDIAHWALKRVQDTYGNYTEYIYENIPSGPIGGATVQEFYIKQITYTKHTGTVFSTYYQIDFTRNNYSVGPSTPALNRKDVITSARSGYLSRIDDLLTEVKVSLVQPSGTTRIRTYRFDYGEKDFNKQQLVKISEYDADHDLFYTNSMEYFDEVENGMVISPTTKNWSAATGGDDIISALEDLTGVPLNIIPSGTPLGTSSSSGYSIALRTGVGIGTDVASVANTLGGSFNYSKSTQNGKVSFIDINGDGLPDKVYENNGNVSYRPNLGQSPSGMVQGFGSPYTITGIGELSKTKSGTRGWGFDANLMGQVGAGKSWSNTSSSTDNYFTDFNGDGFPDMITGSRVKFNTAGDTGGFIRNFTNTITASENVIIPGPLDPELGNELMLPTMDELREEFPQFDHVKVWKAPYDGVISVSSQAYLLQQNTCGDDPEFGFRLTVERTNFSSATVVVGQPANLANSTPSSTINRTISVDEGEVLFFRIHNLSYGCGGEVEWNPTITYTSINNVDFTIPAFKDDNDKNIDVFKAKDDFMVNNGGSVPVNMADTSLSIDFNLPANAYAAFEFSDNIKFKIKKTRIDLETGDIVNEEEWERMYIHTLGSVIGDDAFFSAGTPAPAGEADFLYFFAESTSNVDWGRINWKPKLIGSATGTTWPTVNYHTYDDNLNQEEHWFDTSSLPNPTIADSNDEGTAYMRVSHTFFNQDYGQIFNFFEDEEFPLKINWVVKRRSNNIESTLNSKSFYVYRTTSETDFFGTTWDYIFTKEPVDDPLNITNPSVLVNLSTDTYLFQYDLSKIIVKNINDTDGNIFSAFYVDNKKIGTSNGADITLSMHPNFSTVPFSNDVLDSPFFGRSIEFYGLAYRGWGQFLYNGGLQFERDEEGEISDPTPTNFGDNPIDESVLDLQTIGGNAQDVPDDIDPDDPEITSGDAGLRYTLYNQINEFNKFQNETIKDAVYGFNSNGKLSATIGRFAEPLLQAIYVDPNEITDPNAQIGEFIGLKQYSKAKGKAKTGNFTLVEGTESESTSEVLIQYIDMNGDRYPDIVTGGKIQFTNSLGTPSRTEDYDDFKTGDKNIDRTTGVTLPGLKPNSTDVKPGGNKTNTNISSGINSSTGSSYDSKMYIDMNGDGLPDKVQMVNQIGVPNVVKVKLNLGYGFSDEIIWGSITETLTTTTRRNTGGGLGTGNNMPGDKQSFAVGFGASASTAKMQTTFTDVNGDGLPDLLVNTDDEITPIYKYYLNTGSGFSTTSVDFFNANIEMDYTVSGNIYGSITFGWWFPLPVVLIPIKITLSPSAGVNASFNEKRISIQDINGDGLTEVLTYNPQNNNAVYARLNTVGKTHLLRQVNTPLGGSWTVDYMRNGNTYDLPQNKWVLSSITTSDAFTADNNLNYPVTVTSVAYSGPKYDRRERQFLGYSSVLIQQKEPTTLAVYRYQVKSYHNENYYLSGAEKSTKLHSASGDLLSETTTLYNLLNPDGPTVNFDAGFGNNYMQASLAAQADALLDKSRLFIAPVRVTSTVYEGSDALTSVKEFTSYDNKGNLKTFVDYGTGPDDAYKTSITYLSGLSEVDNGTGFPSKIIVYKNGTTTKLRERSASYYTKGKLNQVTTSLNSTNAAETNRVKFTYDIYGNVKTVNELDNLNAALASYVRTYTYETPLQTYAKEITNSFGDKSLAEYNYSFGVPVLITDTNDQLMRTRIDDRGRVVEVTGPNEMAIPGGNGWTIRTEYKGEAAMTTVQPTVYVIDATGAFIAVNPGAAQPTDKQHYAITRHYDPEIHQGSTPTNQFITISIVDGLGQPIQVKKTLFYNSLVFQVGGIQAKDAFGRVTKSYDPKLQTGTINLSNLSSYTSYVGGTLPPFYTEMKYDVKDRVIEVKQPAETVPATINYSIEDGLFVEKRSNEKSQTLDTYTDIRGRQVKTVQNNEITTTFEYNLINELTRVIDNEGAKTNYFYDFAGRKTEVQHPDRGITTFKYDRGNRLIETKTSNVLLAQGLPTTYTYEFGRLIQIDYPLNPQNQVKYTYGKRTNAVALAERAVGRLFQQEDATGIQVYGYGRMGEVTKNLRSVAVADYHAYWFLTQWKYDSWNRVHEITYPDDEVVAYNYNTGGMLREIKNTLPSVTLPTQFIVKNILYNEFGERTTIMYGNDRYTTYDYDDRHRMNVLQHNFAGLTLKKNYEYDILSNITKIDTEQDSGALPGNGLIGGPVNHNYKYDTYNRLSHADGNYTGPNDLTQPYLQQAYELDMTYNSDHTINSKTQIQMMGTVTSFGGTVSDEVPVEKNSYDLVYDKYATGAYAMTGGNGEYGYQQPHAVREITESPTWVSGLAPDDPRIRKKQIKYDANGNQTEIGETVGELYTSLRKNLWDEENRLMAVDLKPDEESDHPIAIYTYDAGGARTVRYNFDRTDVSSNATEVAQAQTNNVMMYPSGLLMAKAIRLDVKTNEIAYTKHYYIGSERVSAKTGTMRQLGGYDSGEVNAVFPTLNLAPIVTASNTTVDDADNAVIAVHNKFSVTPNIASIADPIRCDFNHDTSNNRLSVYYIHSDHLGSSSYITGQAGNVIQHMEYLPFGETLVDEHTNSFNSPFKFNGKEFDEETGNYYYGARYYDPKWSIFTSVDPLAEKYPDWSSYGYTFNNPITLIDPNGKEPIKPLVGSIGEALDYFRARGFTTVQQISEFYKNPMDANGNKLRGNGYVRYVYTEDSGWIDLRHYFGTIQNGEVVMDALEVSQTAAGYPSAFSYEDLPSNAFGGDAPVYNQQTVSSPNGKYRSQVDVLKQGEDLLNSIEGHFNGAGATSPENAPNFNNLPNKERGKVPDGRWVIKGIPMYDFYSPEERQKMIDSGQYVPQNFSETPYDLTKFPKPSEEYLKK